MGVGRARTSQGILPKRRRRSSTQRVARTRSPSAFHAYNGRVGCFAGREADGRELGSLALLLEPTPPPSALDIIQANLERAIANLLAVRAKVSNPTAKNAVASGILALRKVGRFFDTNPPAVSVTLLPAKAPNPILGKPVYNAADFAAGVQVKVNASDALSGVVPTTLSLKATVDGAMFDLSSLALIVSFDPLTSVLVATATISSTAIPDAKNVFFTVTVADAAMNVTTAATINVMKDIVAPTITIASPVGGTTTVSTSIFLTATATDITSGIDWSTVKAFVDSTDATSAVLVDPPNSKITAALSLTPGSHTILLEVHDVAGNKSSASTTFSSAEIGTLQLRVQALTDTIQEGLAGSCAAQELVVKVTRIDTGEPVSNVALAFDIIQGSGLLEESKTHSSVTDAEGRAAARFVFGPTSAKVRVGLTDIVTEPAEFILNGKLPSIGLVSAPTEDFPGSAFRELFTIQALRPDGSALVDEAVDVLEVDSEGKPITTETLKSLYFVPEAVRTNSSGLARFGAVIKKNAAPKIAHLKFMLSHFFDENNQPVAVTASVAIKARTGVALQFSLESGQGQVAIVGNAVVNPLVAKFLDDGNPSTTEKISFNVIDQPDIPAQNLAEITGITEGTLESTNVVDGIVVGVLIKPDPGSRRAGITVKVLHTGRLPLLIAANPVISSVSPTPGDGGIVPLDTFVIGPRELLFVRRSFLRDSDGELLRDATGNPLANVDESGAQLFERIAIPDRFVRQELLFDEFGSFRTPSPEFEFFVEARLPPFTASSSETEVSSFDRCGDLLDGTEILSSSTRTLVLPKLGDTGRFALFRTKPIVMTAGGRDSSSSPALLTLPSGHEVIQGMRLGFFKATSGGLVTPVHCTAKAKRVVIIGVDGLRQDTLVKNFDKLPGFKKLFGNNYFSSKDVKSVYPSVTFCATSSMITGAQPKDHGVLGGEVFLRDKQVPEIGGDITIFKIVTILKEAERPRRHYAFIPEGTSRGVDLFLPYVAPLLGGKSLDEGTPGTNYSILTKPTLYRLAWARQVGAVQIKGPRRSTAVILHWINPPLQKPNETRYPKDITNVVISSLSERVIGDATAVFNAAKALDEMNGTTFVEFLKEKKKIEGSMQDIVFLWLPGADHVLHGNGRKFSDGSGGFKEAETLDEAQFQYVRLITDGILDAIANAFPSRELKDTVFILTADHGSYETAKDSFIPRQGLEVFFASEGSRKLLTKLGTFTDSAQGDFDAVMTFSGPTANIYLRGASGKWTDPPRMDVVQDLAFKLARANAVGDFASDLKAKFDLILFKAKFSDEYQAVSVDLDLTKTPRKIKTISVRSLSDFLSTDYKKLQLQVFGAEADVPYFDIEAGIKALNSKALTDSAGRSPDILLVSHFDQSQVNRRLYFSSTGFRATHGSYMRGSIAGSPGEDVLVPFVVGSPGDKSKQFSQIVKSLEPLIKALGDVRVVARGVESAIFELQYAK